LKSYQNLIFLQNLYRLKALGFNYTEPFLINEKTPNLKPSSLQEIQQAVKGCHLCDLSKSRSQSMCGYGNTKTKLMIIDNHVSQSQDTSNNYYIGRSGEILKNMIENVLKLNIDDVFYTHAVKCKPLNSNTPSSSEWDSCKGYLFSQLEYIAPKVVVTLGEEAYKKVTSDEENFENIRGHVIDLKEYKLIPIYHPSHLLRNPELKKITLNDLKTIKSCL